MWGSWCEELLAMIRFNLYNLILIVYLNKNRINEKKIKCVWGWCEELLAVMREQEGGWPQPSNLHWRPNQWDCSKQKIKDKPMRLYDIWNKIKFFNSIDMACSLFNAIQPSNWHWRPNRWDCRKQKLRFLIVCSKHPTCTENQTNEIVSKKIKD